MKKGLRKLSILKSMVTSLYESKKLDTIPVRELQKQNSG